RERDPRCVEDVRPFRLPLRIALEADVRALRLERAAVAARRDLEPLTHCGPPGLNVEALLRDEAEIAGTPFGDLHRQPELLDYARGPCGELVEHLPGGLGRREDDHLDLVEPVDALDPT